MAANVWDVLVAALTVLLLTKSGLIDTIALPLAGGLIVELGTFAVMMPISKRQRRARSMSFMLTME